MGAHIKWISLEQGSTVKGNTRKKRFFFSFRNGRINERKTFIGRRIECFEK